MAEFKVGGKAICIESREFISTMGLTFRYYKDRCYSVSDLLLCKCGSLSLWLGDVNNLGSQQFSECGICWQLIETKKVFVHSKFFVPLDDFKEVTFEKIKEQVQVSAQ